MILGRHDSVVRKAVPVSDDFERFGKVAHSRHRTNVANSADTNADSVPQIYVRIFKNLRKSAWQYFNFEKGQPLANSRVLKPVAHIVREASRVITMLFSKRR